jgi:hypothetical protein
LRFRVASWRGEIFIRCMFAEKLDRCAAAT